MRFQLRGGVWKNTEDEILKAAVMKYGLNQWSRISSLLTRKSAKQCKARWYEWLDPSIKKTEWCREEDEKLLHLAKILPTQWRTISPIIGRTAAQCLEHYEKIISKHELQDGEEVGEDPKRIRPGEIDPAPETKPARPDPIDMDEDEQEMLQEARSRLSNTKGKKAKRKAREKMLQEARRLATLQKQRELKAAGVTVKERFKKVREEMDYNKEIPFYQKQPIGFYDTTKEDQKAIENKKPIRFRNLTSETFEGKRRDEIEARERKKDIKRQRLFRQANLPEAIKNINRLNKLGIQSSIKNRLKINLPEPQVSDKELENMARLNTNEFRDDENGKEWLVSQFNGATPTPLLQTPSLQTPFLQTRTPIAEDTVRKGVEDVIALRDASNPLLGGENVELHNPNLAKIGAIPVKTPIVTPNPLKMSLKRDNLGLTPNSVANSPFSSVNSVYRTPYRDILNINTPISSMSQMDMKKMEKRRLKDLKKALNEGFKGLPKPKNRHLRDLIMPEMELDTNYETEECFREDQADLDMKELNKRKILEEEELKRRSLTCQRSLPRPNKINVKFGRLTPVVSVSSSSVSSSMDDILEAAKWIDEEVISMLRYDNAKYPLNGDVSSFIPKRDHIDDHYLNQARVLIKKETNLLINSRQKTDQPDLKNFNTIWQDLDNDIKYLPSSRVYGSFKNSNKNEQLQCLEQEFTLLRNQIDIQAKNIKKDITKMDILTGGYQNRVRNKKLVISNLLNEINEKCVERLTFEKIALREHRSIPIRQEVLKGMVKKEMERENVLQKRYQNLMDEFQKYDICL